MRNNPYQLSDSFIEAVTGDVPGEGEACDAENCMHSARAENWVNYRVVHNEYLLTSVYAHFCDGHYKTFPRHVFTIELPFK